MLEDKDEIRELLAIYSRCSDFDDLETWISCWTPDGRLNISGRPPIQGLEELRAHGASWKGDSLHCVCNEVIEVAGDEARATSYVTLIIGAQHPRVLLGGRYNDVLHRVGGRWQFAVRNLERVLLGEDDRPHKSE